MAEITRRSVQGPIASTGPAFRVVQVTVNGSWPLTWAGAATSSTTRSGAVSSKALLAPTLFVSSISPMTLFPSAWTRTKYVPGVSTNEMSTVRGS